MSSKSDEIGEWAMEAYGIDLDLEMEKMVVQAIIKAMVRAFIQQNPEAEKQVKKNWLKMYGEEFV